MRFLLLGFSCFIFLAAKSQPLSQSLESKIKPLLKKESDTVISLYVDHFHFPISDSVKGLGEIRENEVAYIVSKSGSNTQVIKHINYFNIIMSDNYTNSNPLNFSNDSIFSFLSTNREAVQSVIFPYIYKLVNDTSAQFDILRSSHPTIFNVGIHTLFRNFYFQINTEDMEYQIDHFPPNLNYHYNINSKSYLLFLKIMTLIKTIDKDFKFRK